jgi:hypothetical protein
MTSDYGIDDEVIGVWTLLGGDEYMNEVVGYGRAT